MAKNRLTPRHNGASVAKTSTPDPALVDDPNMSEVDRFVADHPEPIADPVEKPVVQATVGDPGDETPEIAEPKVDSQGEPIAEPPAIEAEPAAATADPAKPAAQPEPVKAAEPTAPVAETPAPVEAKPAVVAEPKPVVYDPHEKFALAPDVEWTREQVITRLQQYQDLLPRAEQGDKLIADLGYPDYKVASERLVPLFQRLKDEPDTAKFLDAVLAADARKLEYLRDSAAFWDSKVASGEISPEPVAAKPAPVDVTADPRVKEALTYIERERAKAGSERGRREWESAFEAYPFLRSDNAAREALMSLANALYNEDRSKGIDDLECRGIAAAVELNKALYDARKVVMQRQDTAAAVIPAASIPPAAVAPPAVLGSTGPAPTSRPGRPKIYKGDPEEAVAAFVKDFPS